MSYRKLEIIVGTFMLGGLAAIAFLALKIGAGSLTGSDTYLLHARFRNVAGVNPGSQVVISGVTVGKVDAVHLDTGDFSAVVDLRIRSDIKLPTDSIISVKTSGLIGDKFLAVQPGGDEEMAAPGDTLTMTESTVDIESLISRFAFGSVDGKDKEKSKP